MAEPLQTPDVFLAAFDGAQTRDLEPGDVLLTAGTPADQVFNILDGMVMLSREGRDGRRQVLAFLCRDNFLGFTATDRYFFTAAAVTPARIACCSRQAFEARLASDPKAERAFINMTFRVLEDLVDALYSLGQRSSLERLAVFVLYLRHARRHAENIADDSTPALNDVALPMTREDIADFLGLQKETVTRGFGHLEERGLIRRAGSHAVHIVDLAGLRELAGVVDFTTSQRLPVGGAQAPRT